MDFRVYPICENGNCVGVGFSNLNLCMGGRISFSFALAHVAICEM